MEGSLRLSNGLNSGCRTITPLTAPDPMERGNTGYWSNGTGRPLERQHICIFIRSSEIGLLGRAPWERIRRRLKVVNLYPASTAVATRLEFIFFPGLS